MTQRLIDIVCGFLAVLALAACGDTAQPGQSDIASGETAGVKWTDPVDPVNSLTLTADGQGYLVVTNPTGQVAFQSKEGGFVGLSLRSGFPITTNNGDPETAIPINVVASVNSRDQSIALYMLEPDSGSLLTILDEPVSSHIETPVGVCLYRSNVSGQLYLFVTDRTGSVSQWQLYDSGRGTIRGTIQRTWSIGRSAGNCRTDDVNGWVDIDQPGVGTWRYGAEPKDSFNERRKIN